SRRQSRVAGMGQVDHRGARPPGHRPRRAVADVGRVVERAVGRQLPGVDAGRPVRRVGVVERTARGAEVVVGQMDRVAAVAGQVVDADHRPDRHDEDPPALAGVQALVDAEDVAAPARPRVPPEHGGDHGHPRVGDVEHGHALAGVLARRARLIRAGPVPRQLDVAAAAAQVVRRHRPDVTAVALSRPAGQLVDGRHLALHAGLGKFARAARAGVDRPGHGPGRHRRAQQPQRERDDERTAPAHDVCFATRRPRSCAIHRWRHPARYGRRVAPGRSTVPDDSGLRIRRRGRGLRRLFTLVIVALLVFALVGLLGVRTTTISAAGGGYRLQLHYAKVVRPGLAVPWELRVTSAGGFDGPVTLATKSSYLDIYDENSLDPDPVHATQDGDRVIW